MSTSFRMSGESYEALTPEEYLCTDEPILFYVIKDRGSAVNTILKRWNELFDRRFTYHAIIVDKFLFAKLERELYEMPRVKVQTGFTDNLMRLMMPNGQALPVYEGYKDMKGVRFLI